MSVRVNDRHLSDIEYENTYSILYSYIANKIKRLPKRYRYFLGKPFNDDLNSIYEEIIQMTFLYQDCNTTVKNIFRLYDEYYGGYKLTRKYYSEHPNEKRHKKTVRV